MADAWLPLPDLAAPFNGLLFACALSLATLIALQTVLLAPPWNRRVVGPIVLLGLSLALMAVRGIIIYTPKADEVLAEIAFFLLLLGLARCGFVLHFHGLFHFLHRDVPKIYLDIIQTSLYLTAFFVALAVAGVEPLSIITGSAVLSVVLGLSLKDTLGNLFAGLAIQAQHPFEIGDWIQFDQNPSHIGEVVEFNWRATKVITLDLVEVIVPNGTLGVGHIVNFTKPTAYSRRSVYVNAPYDVPPQQVQKVILGAIAEAWGVLDTPPPSVVTNAFDERGVQYWVRFFTSEFGRRDRVDGGVRDCIWYAMSRAGIAIPGPLRTITVRQEPDASASHEDPVTRREQALRRLDLFGLLSSENLHRLALLAQTRLYGPQEVIVRQGESGEDLFVVMKGRVSVYVEQSDGPRVSLTDLGPGEFFGEMSLVTGERRTATVQAGEECEVLVIGAAAFRQVLEASADLADRVRESVERRQAHTDDRLEDSALAGEKIAARPTGLLRLMQQLLGERGPSSSRSGEVR